MEAEKSQDMLSICNLGRTRKASGVIQLKSEDQRIRGANGISPHLSPKAWDLGQGAGGVSLPTSLKVQEPGVLMSFLFY